MSSLLRSTKLVRYFTGAARTLILNSAKTAEANLLANTKSLCLANNVLTRDYATSKKTESLEPLLQKLDSEVRKFGRITKRDIDEVFDEIRAKHDITSSQSLLVIRCCGELVPEELPEQRTLLVQKIWNVLIERGIPMDISHYNALLRVYLENEHEFSPAQFLEELEKKGLQPNRVTYQRLMWRYCQDGDVDGATSVLEKMRELNMPISEPVLNALVMGHAFRGDTEGAKIVVETMENAGLQATNRTYSLLACGYAKKGDIEGVKNIIKTANDKNVYMTDKDILDIIEHLAIDGHKDKVELLFDHLQKGPGYNQDVCNLILKLINKGHEETAKKIMKTMPKTANIDTMFKGAFFVKQLLRIKKPVDNIIKTCRELQEEDLVPYALYIATEGALQQGHTELAQRLFKELKKDGFEIRQHYYWPLLVQKGKEKDEEGLLQILRDMSSEGIPPSGEALRDYVIPYLMGKESPQNVILKLQIANVPVTHSARNLMVELLESGKIDEAANIALKYCPRGQYALVARPLLNSLHKTKNIDAFVSILHVIGSPPTFHTEDQTNEDSQTDDKVSTNEIGRIVKSAVRSLIKPDLCEELLVAVHSKGLRIDTQSAEAIEQYLGDNMTTKLSQLLSQLTSSDLEMVPLEAARRDYVQRTSAQLEQLISQVQSKGGNNLNRLQKQLLLAYLKENNVEKIKSHLKELDLLNFDINIVTLAQLFEFFCQNDDIEAANEIRAKIAVKDPDFLLHKLKLVEMAYALARANRFEESVKFLKDNKPQTEDTKVSDFMLSSKCWQMLNYLAEQKDDSKVKEMTKVLIENDYIKPSNILLGPSIKVHLLKNDIDGALAEFENCCKNYRSTPWKGELMKALITKEDASKLQWLADLGTQIHGEVNILHDLVLAFVECRRLRQARRILETPGLQTRHKRLNDACERYVEEGQSEHLEALLEATKDLSHIDRSNIFYHLLVTYCKAEETDKALGLWTILQEEGEIPSEQFLIYLGKHLKQKNKEIPFVVPVEVEAVKTEKVIIKKENIAPKAKLIETPTKIEVTANIEKLIKEGNAIKAMDYALRMIEEGQMPKAKVLKYLLRNLAEAGEVEKIQLLGKRLNDSMKRNVTYDDKLTLAIFTRGAGNQHIDNLVASIEKAETDEELDEVLKRYPRSNALASAVNDEKLASKCRKVAEIAASKDRFMPANLLWMEYLLAGKNQEADSLWNQWLKNKSVVVYRRLLQESHTRNQPQLIERLISTLKSNDSISLGAIGNAYSRLINLHVMNKNIEDAKAAYEKALESGVKSEHFNANCLKRLKSAVEGTGQKFEYSV